MTLLVLLLPFAAAQAGNLDAEPGMISPDSPLYGLGMAKDNVMMRLGLASPGKIAQKRAAEAQQMREQGNYAAAERAAQELGKVAEKASDEDADSVQKAATVIADIHVNAPDAAKDGLQTALENIAKNAPKDVKTTVIGEGLGSLCDSKQDCMMYCTNNEQECLAFCDGNPDNELCQEMEWMSQDPSGQDMGSGMDRGLGDLCDSRSECMTYCMNNMPECERYCMEHPDNVRCQEMERMDPSSDGQDMGPEESGDYGDGYNPDANWDLEENGVPQFITYPMVDLDYLVDEAGLEAISYFRSGYGHSHTGDVESCRSMKHYYTRSSPPENDLQVEIRAPVDGRIERINDYGNDNDLDNRISIKVKEYPAFEVGFHHVTPVDGMQQGDEVEAGELIAHQYESRTLFEPEIHVFVSTDEGEKSTYVSPFEAMTDDVFSRYEQFGAKSPQDFIISKEERDSNPLCNEGEDDFDGSAASDHENFFPIGVDEFSFDK